MAHTSSRQSVRQQSCAQSIASESSYAAAPRASPAVTRRQGTRAIRENSTATDAVETHQPPAKVVVVPAHYTLPSTVPSPFAGTLDASLDAILVWGSLYANTKTVVDVLLQDVDTTTNWPELVRKMWTDGDKPMGRGRYLVEELLFLVTRKLLPEQIVENRAAMARLYNCKKQLAIRMVLRYDMLREWKFDASHHAITVPSVPSPILAGPIPPSTSSSIFPNRLPLMPNIIATLIAAPPEGFTTHGVRERMKHHITDLDDYLLLSDEKVLGWNNTMLVFMTSQIVLQWQWLRQNNEILQDLEANGWDGMEGKADECQWIADEVKKPSWFKKEKGGRTSTEPKKDELN